MATKNEPGSLSPDYFVLVAGQRGGKVCEGDKERTAGKTIEVTTSSFRQGSGTMAHMTNPDSRRRCCRKNFAYQIADGDDFDDLGVPHNWKMAQALLILQVLRRSAETLNVLW